ncbi:signal peptide peptidase SppA [Maricaulaceae bacterium EIL42A08]|nr:signal peptide peptidase SppA [Maricaulaceae bacterium EIL42A08]
MRHFFTTVFASMLGVIAAVLALFVLATLAVSAQLANLIEANDSFVETSESTTSVILELDLRAPRLDQAARSVLPSSGPASLVETLTALQRAASDPQVAGIFVRTGAGVTPSDAEEINRALTGISQAGKPVVAHIQTLTSGSTAPYFAVVGADEIWMHPSGWFAATGLQTQQIFLGDGLSRLGVEAQFLQLYEYKGAAEIFTRDVYSDAAREAITAWMESLHETAITHIANGRNLTPDQAAQLIEAGPYLATEALEIGLVDQLGQTETARATIVARHGPARVESLDTYARQVRAPEPGPVIALVNGQGSVVDGPAPRGLAAPQVIASDTLANAINAAAAATDVRAIVLRLDTGGGSATASDQIAAAILRARQAGTPVIVSFGSVAASGGYYIAAPSDYIIANAGTLTGSIGVISGKVAIGPALERAGITFDSVTVGGAFASAMSPDTPYTEAQRAAIEAWAQATYDDFTALVAEGRDLPLARVESLARGRVWTGAQALELGLIDEIGGYPEAIAAARRLAGISPDQSVTLRTYPAELTGLARLQAILNGSVQSAEALGSLAATLERPQVQALLRSSQLQNVPVSTQAAPPEPR